MALTLRDALGREQRFAAPPRRIVSLVPSWTETLFALGAGGKLVGVTDYCVHPAGGVAALPKLGGTKNPRVSEIVALHPDLVVANKEENRSRTVSDLENAGVPVLVTYARTLDRALQEIGQLARISGTEESGGAMVAELEAARARARSWVRSRRPRVAALVWKSPYMVVGKDTFADALLCECGGANPFANREGRYPRVEAAELAAARPDVILLPSEPYAFAEADRQELLRLDCPAARQARIHLVEGELLSWYGPRIARALDLFSELLNA